MQSTLQGGPQISIIIFSFLRLGFIYFFVCFSLPVSVFFFFFLSAAVPTRPGHSMKICYDHFYLSSCYFLSVNNPSSRPSHNIKKLQHYSHLVLHWSLSSVTREDWVTRGKDLSRRVCPAGRLDADCPR